MPVFDEVHKTFLSWRKGGQYVDEGDLYLEYCYQADQMKTRLEAQRNPEGWLPSRQRALLEEIEKREKAIQKSEKMA
eukprot:8624477-Pyramimonas_sp.AAC.1